MCAIYEFNSGVTSPVLWERVRVQILQRGKERILVSSRLIQEGRKMYKGRRFITFSRRIAWIIQSVHEKAFEKQKRENNSRLPLSFPVCSWKITRKSSREQMESGEERLGDWGALRLCLFSPLLPSIFVVYLSWFLGNAQVVLDNRPRIVLFAIYRRPGRRTRGRDAALCCSQLGVPVPFPHIESYIGIFPATRSYGTWGTSLYYHASSSYRKTYLSIVV